MSKALKYLMGARPKAMGSYFDFIKQAGRHLDPKTRAIISVITKVENQTEAGFRQYLPKALQAGASADEILDALLYAFPSLGLSKIIWAIDILLDMDLPEFHPDRLGNEPAWHDLIAVTDLGQGTTLVEGREQDYFVCREGGHWRVYSNICPHQSTRIPATALTGTTVTCPKHGWQFDLRNGNCIAGGDRPLRVLTGKVEGGRLWVYH